VTEENKDIEIEVFDGDEGLTKIKPKKKKKN